MALNEKKTITETTTERVTRNDLDPIINEDNSHPVATAAGAATIGTLATLGGAAIAGPLGGVAGALIGGALGGAIGHEAGEAAEAHTMVTGNEYGTRIGENLRERFTERHYARGRSYDEYDPAYQYGLNAHDQYGAYEWDDRLEAQIREGWEKTKHATQMAWADARDAVRDAFDGARDEIRNARQSQDAYLANERNRIIEQPGMATFSSKEAYERLEPRLMESFRLTHADKDFSEYRPAYQYGVESVARYGGMPYDDALETELRREWEHRAESLPFFAAKPAIENAYRETRAIYGSGALS